MSKIAERRLGSEGTEWVRRGLAGRKIGDLILARYSLDSGVPTALLSDTVSEDDARHFEEGVLASPDLAKAIIVRHPDGSASRLVPKPNTDQCVVAIIHRFLRQSSSHVCVFEDQIHSPGEPFAERHKDSVVAIDGVLFHILDPSRADAETIAATVRAAGFIHMTLGVLGSLRTRVERSSLDLTELVSTLETIIVDAYDGESYVIWRPAYPPKLG